MSPKQAVGVYRSLCLYMYSCSFNFCLGVYSFVLVSDWSTSSGRGVGRTGDRSKLGVTNRSSISSPTRGDLAKIDDATVRSPTGLLTNLVPFISSFCVSNFVWKSTDSHQRILMKFNDKNWSEGGKLCKKCKLSKPLRKQLIY